MESIKQLYKIGHGPSSSHTMGPLKAAQEFGASYPEAASFNVTLSVPSQAPERAT